MKKYITLIALLISSLNLMAQNAVELGSLKKEWTELANQNGLVIEGQLTSCKLEGVDKPFDYVFFKLSNTTDEEISFSFNASVNYSDGTCAGCEESIENTRTFTIAPNTTIIGDCSATDGRVSVLIRNPYQNTFGNEPISVEIINLEVK